MSESGAIDLAADIGHRDRTLPAMLARGAERFGERTLVRAGGESWSFAEAPRQAALWAGRLAAAGIAAGDRVAIICGNRLEFLGLFLGCGWLGAVSVPLNVAARGFSLAHMLHNSGARLLAIEADALPALDGLDMADLALERIWLIGGEAGGPERVGPVPATPVPPAGSVVGPARLGPGDLLTILYTSGTTGLSKGVCAPHAQYFFWAHYVGGQLGLRDGDVLHTTLPLFHTNALGTFYQALLHGGTLQVEPRFSVSAFWARVVESGATVTYVLGAMVPMLLAQPVRPEERGHRVRVALAPGVPAPMQDAFTARTGIGLIDGYGATESNAVIGCDLSTRRDGHMGRVVEGFEARVVDADDAAVPDGTPGELLLRAREPYAFATGYWGMPERTVAAWRNLWLHTGDRVERSPDGYFRFLDRMTDSIRRRGENISSYEVEQVLFRHPAVAGGAVFAVRSELAEDEVMAALILRPGASVSPEELVRHCEGRMSYFAVPRFIEIVADVPRTENGKIQKFALRARGVTAQTWDREAAGLVLKR